MPEYCTLEKQSLSKVITEVSLEQHQAQAIQFFEPLKYFYINIILSKNTKNEWCDKLVLLDAKNNFIQKKVWD